MTLTAYTTIALVMSAGIIWSMVFTVLFNKGYLRRLQRPRASGKAGGGRASATRP